jgi:Uma2 family endonuclease
MLAISQQPRMSIKEYLEWEPQQDLRHEYINGEVFAMTGGTLAHNDITLNLYRTLYGVADLRYESLKMQFLKH